MKQRGYEENGSKNKKDYHHVWWATSEIKRLAVAPRREGGSGVVSIADCVMEEDIEHYMLLEVMKLLSLQRQN